jgi:hypothetical protein
MQARLTDDPASTLLSKGSLWSIKADDDAKQEQGFQVSIHGFPPFTKMSYRSMPTEYGTARLYRCKACRAAC